MSVRYRWLALASLILASGGCAGRQRPIPPTATLSPRALVDLDAVPGLYKPYNPQAAAEFLRSGRASVLPRPDVPHKSVLALSGGGMFGAYTAGVLKGWTASGKRPTFDVVTGISTGALIAPLAFLGPEYDEYLERRYTTLTTRDIYRYRPIIGLLTADSLTDSTPLRNLIAEEITEDVVNRVARAYSEGRRLYIGTTNLDSKRLIIWDMGAIASSARPGRVALFRRVVLASCSFPGVLPPVSIDVDVDGLHYTEIHADGGVIASIFLDMSVINSLHDLDPFGDHSPPAPMDLYAIVAGKLYIDPAPVKRRLFSVAEESLGGVLQARTEGDLVRLFLFSSLTGGQFQLAAVPQEMKVNPNFLAFDPAEMRDLFDVGYRFASAGGPWRATPPGGEVSEQRLPRSGVHFRTVPDAGDVAGSTPPDPSASPLGPFTPRPAQAIPFGP